MLADGIVLMEGSLEGMLYKLHITTIPSSTHANLIQSLGTNSIADGTRTQLRASVGCNTFVMC